METFKKNDFAAAGINKEFVQDNESSSTKGVLRGLHFQKAPHAQSKLTRVIKGAVLDVAVDIRKGSPTYCQPLLTAYSAPLAHIYKLQLLQEVPYEPFHPRLANRSRAHTHGCGFIFIAILMVAIIGIFSFQKRQNMI